MAKPRKGKNARQKRKATKQNKVAPLSIQFYKGALTAAVAHVSAWLLLSSVDKLVYLAGHTTVLLAIQAMELLQR